MGGLERTHFSKQQTSPHRDLRIQALDNQVARMPKHFFQLLPHVPLPLPGKSYIYIFQYSPVSRQYKLSALVNLTEVQLQSQLRFKEYSINTQTLCLLHIHVGNTAKKKKSKNNIKMKFSNLTLLAN